MMDQTGTEGQHKIIHTASSRKNTLGKAAFVCGIIAVSLNLLMITAIFGLILSIISIVLGAKTYKHTIYGKAGLVLGLLSIFVIAAYALSAIAIKIADPFL